MGKYLIMVKDNIVGNIEINGNYTNIISYEHILNRIFADPSKWITERIVSYERTNLSNILKVLNIRTIEDFVVHTRAVSVVDCFWVKAENEVNVRWKDINAYSNRISNILARAALDGEDLLGVTKIKTPSPQYRVDGTAEKCVKRKDGSIYLIKTDGIINRAFPSARVYSEFIVSNIQKQIGFSDFVEYSLSEKMTVTGNIKPYCMCKLYTNEDLSSVAYGDSIYGDKNILDIAKELHRTNRKSSDTIREMLLLDSLTLNIDRHDSNIELLYSPDNMQLCKVAPIFDNDYALGGTFDIEHRQLLGVYNELADRQTRTGLGSFNNQAALVMSPNLINKLKRLDISKLHIDDVAGMSSKRKQFIKYLLERRMHDILQIAERKFGNG